MDNAKQNQVCHSEDVAAYLDGEMNGEELLCFEKHLSECERCTSELQTQKRLLNTIDFAFGFDEKTLPLPTNFTKVIKTTAESNIQGLCKNSEKKHALHWCVLLGILSFLLIGGANFSDSVFSPAKNFLKIISVLFDVIGLVVYDFVVGLVVITRAVSRRFIFESNPINIVIFLLFAVSIILLSRLILRYKRA